jgi:anti-sigma factor RsiW
MTTQNPNQDLAELAPFYVAGALTPDELARFEAALAQDPELARNVAAARAERDEILALNEALPAPSARALDTLFAKIDAEPARKPSLWARLDLGGALAGLFSPRALGWATAAACAVIALQAGLLTQSKPGQPDAQYNTASGPQENARAAGAYALVSFAPGANMEAVGALLGQTGAQIVEGPRAGGFYRLRLGGADLAPAEAQRKIDALRQANALVRFVAPSP